MTFAERFLKALGLQWITVEPHAPPPVETPATRDPRPAGGPHWEQLDVNHVRVDGRVMRLGRVVEGTMSLQTVCPVCEYGLGYNECFIDGAYELRVLRCEVCGGEFFGPSMK